MRSVSRLFFLLADNWLTIMLDALWRRQERALRSDGASSVSFQPLQPDNLLSCHRYENAAQGGGGGGHQGFHSGFDIFEEMFRAKNAGGGQQQQVKHSCLDLWSSLSFSTTLLSQSFILSICLFKSQSMVPNGLSMPNIQSDVVAAGLRDFQHDIFALVDCKAIVELGEKMGKRKHVPHVMEQGGYVLFAYVQHMRWFIRA